MSIPNGNNMEVTVGAHRSCGGVQAEPSQRGPPRRLGKELVREIAEVHAEVDAAVHGNAVQRDIAVRLLKGVHVVEAEKGTALQDHLLAAPCASTLGSVSMDNGTTLLAFHDYCASKQINIESEATIWVGHQFLRSCAQQGCRLAM